MFRRSVALALALVVATAACGDGNADSQAGATTSPPPTSMAAPAATTTTAPAETTPLLPTTATNADKSTTTVRDVSRIIPLNGDIAEVVYALGLGDRVVATDVSATYPAEAAAKPKIGYQRALAAEGILSFQPTVLIGDTNAGPAEVIAQLRATDVPVVILPVDLSLEGPAAKIRAVAAALGVPNRGAVLAATVAADLAAATRKGSEQPTKPRAVLLYLRGAQAQLIGGRGSGADTVIRAAGGTDVASEAGINGFAPITPEALVTASPEVIIVTTTGLQSVGGVDGLLKIPGIAQTPAGQNRRVLSYEDQYLLGGGPRLPQLVAELVTALHASSTE